MRIRPHFLPFVIACLCCSSQAVAEGQPPASSDLFCSDVRGAVLPLRNAKLSNLIAAYRTKVGWEYSAIEAAPNAFELRFSPSGNTSDQGSAIFKATREANGLMLNSVDYRASGQVEHVEGGEVCIRVIILLSP